MARDDNMIAALKRERAVYESRGDTDRVRQVDEQLAYYQGDEAEAPVEKQPLGRTGPEGAQQTADAAAGRAAKKTAAKKTAASKPTTSEDTTGQGATEQTATPSGD
jgi:hypothetical protein